MAVCDYEYSKEGHRLTVGCLGCVYGASIEDFEQCMARTIDKLMEVKQVESVVLSQTREFEYDFQQTQILVEIARAIVDLLRNKKVLSPSKMALPENKKFIPGRFAFVQRLIIDRMRRDPVGVYVELIREIRRINAAMRDSGRDEAEDLSYYLSNALFPIKDALEATKMIKFAQPYLTGYQIGDRQIYREIFHPLIRPNFMLTRYMMIPPQGAQEVDRYSVDDAEVQIFRLPGAVQNHYHVLPPEFTLTEEQYTVLDIARQYMAAHKPTREEFLDPERIRDIFSNIGRDMLIEISESAGAPLGSAELKLLSKILTRYTVGYGILEVVLADPGVQDIYLNSPVGVAPLFLFHGKYEECITNIVPTKEDADAWATRFRIESGRPLDEANPVLDTDIRIPGGRARIAAITRTLSPEGLAFAFRRHRDKPWTYPLFISAGMMNPLSAGLMSFMIDGARTILIAGTRSAGKTSFLGATMAEIMKRYRIISIEDTLELPVESLRELGYNIERLKSRSVITHIESELATDEAIRTSLRLGDSCLILGEVRSSLRGNEEVMVVENGEAKRVSIASMEGKTLDGIQVPTLGFDLKINLSKLAGFVKHPERAKLLEITTQTGRKITVTHDHSLFTATRDFRLAAIECSNLKTGDQIVIPSFIPYGFNDIDSLNLLELLPDFRVENFEAPIRQCISKVGWKKASEICKIRTGDIYNYFRTNQRTNIPIGSFKDLTDSAETEYNPAELFIRRGTSNRIPAVIPVNDDFCRFLGYYVSEGYHTTSEHESGGMVVLTNSDKIMINDFHSLSRSLFGIEPKSRQVKGAGVSTQVRISSAPLARLISKLGCGRICTEKRIPPIIYGLSKNKIAAFLRGLYSGDGCFTASSRSGNCIRYTTTSKRLAEDLMYLLLSFGIVATLREKKVKVGNALWNVEFKNRGMVETFLREIGFVQKQPKLMVKAWSHTRSSTIFFDNEALKKHLKCPRKYRHLARFQRCSKEYLEKVVLDKECKASEQLKAFACGHFFLDAIKELREIELEKPEPVYDLSVEPSQNFVAGFGGVLAHNTEAKALYEAMRIGALSNVVAGTIHGDTPYGVFDRVVNDLGVPPTSFKATDIIMIANRLKSADGLHTARRVIEITEVQKEWSHDPLKEKGFTPLMVYNAKKDILEPTETFLNGESIIINEIARRVKEWRDNWEAIWDNIQLRAKIKETLVDYSKKTGNPNILEARFASESNDVFHLVCEKVKEEYGSLDSKRIFALWDERIKTMIKKL